VDFVNRDFRREILQSREFVKPSEAAFLVNRSKSTINRWIAEGALVVYQSVVKRQILVRRTDVYALILERSGESK